MSCLLLMCRCSSLFAGCCSVYVVCYLLVCWLLFGCSVVCCALCVVRCLIYVVRVLLFCCLFFVCFFLFVFRIRCW